MNNTPDAATITQNLGKVIEMVRLSHWIDAICMLDEVEHAVRIKYLDERQAIAESRWTKETTGGKQ